VFGFSQIQVARFFLYWLWCQWQHVWVGDVGNAIAWAICFFITCGGFSHYSTGSQVIVSLGQNNGPTIC